MLKNDLGTLMTRDTHDAFEGHLYGVGRSNAATAQRYRSVGTTRWGDVAESRSAVSSAAVKEAFERRLGSSAAVRGREEVSWASRR